MPEMGQVHQPRDLFLQELADILFVERRLVHEVLPELQSQVQDEELLDGLGRHLAQTRQHVTNVERVFPLLDAETSAAHSPPLEGLKSQHDELAEKIDDAPLRDLFNATAAAHTEHYEIAAYTSLIALAKALGKDDAVKLLEENLDDEESALKELEQASKRLAGQVAG